MEASGGLSAEMTGIAKKPCISVFVHGQRAQSLMCGWICDRLMCCNKYETYLDGVFFFVIIRSMLPPQAMFRPSKMATNNGIKMQNNILRY